MITYEFFKDKRVTVFGLGLNGGGVATVRFLAEHGVREIIVTDAKRADELTSSIDRLKDIRGVTYILGEHREQDFVDVDMVIINPGIPWTNEHVQKAREANIPVEMDASIFFQLCPCPIIGVTGSKGKTTTSTLIAAILEEAGKDVISVGIGQVPVLDALQHLTATSVVVFELSSWRLSSLQHIHMSPHIAVFTNLFPDHLNYYGTMDAYARDKQLIFANQTAQDYAVYEESNILIQNLAKNIVSKKALYNEQSSIDHASMSELRVYVDDAGNINAKIHNSFQKILNIDEIRMRGEHNRGNILAAITASLAFDVEVQSIQKAIVHFPGIEHRLEFVREKDGIQYYNDTAATVPEAAINAMKSFEEPIILIAGGNNKKLDFENMARTIQEKTKDCVFFSGEATDNILRLIEDSSKDSNVSKSYTQVKTMQDAVRIATQQATVGDVVLLSPGATSFGLFKNEFDRGEQYRDCVHKL